MRWTREEYISLLTYNHPPRPMFSELFGPIVNLDSEWRLQGATEEMISMHEFSFDYVPFYNIGQLGLINCPATIVLEDTATHYRAIDQFGRHVRMDKRTSTIPLPEDFPVETMDDWLKIKPMFSYDACRLPKSQIEEAKRLQSQGVLIRTAIMGGFDILRELMGEVNCCIAFYEDPELVFDILNTISEMNVRVLDEMSSQITVDQLSIHEDMAGKSGPMIGPHTVNEFLKPYYLKSWEILSARGTKIFSQDSDGNMNAVMDAFIDCGVNVFYPCEPMANMDIVELRKKYGHKIAFIGGLDKHVIRKTKADIDRELEYKMQDIMMDGGIVFGLDHRIPNGTSLENYIYYVDRAREILGLPDFRTCENCWGRMAF